MRLAINYHRATAARALPATIFGREITNTSAQHIEKVFTTIHKHGFG